MRQKQFNNPAERRTLHCWSVSRCFMKFNLVASTDRSPDRSHAISAPGEFHRGASPCRTFRCNSFSHWSWWRPPFLLHLRDRRARQQREMCQRQRSVPSRENACKAAPLGQTRITVPNLFIPKAFAGYPWITLREFKRHESEPGLDRTGASPLLVRKA